MNKNYNKNNKKQQRIRVLNTGELGTVTDQILMKRGDRIMQYIQVKLDKYPHLDRWFWADQLGPVEEICNITLSDEQWMELYLRVIYNHEQGGFFSIDVTGKPSNLKEHDPKGLPMLLTGALLKGLGVGEENVSVQLDGRPVIPAKK